MLTTALCAYFVFQIGKALDIVYEEVRIETLLIRQVLSTTAKRVSFQVLGGCFQVLGA